MPDEEDEYKIQNMKCVSFGLLVSECYEKPFMGLSRKFLRCARVKIIRTGLSAHIPIPKSCKNKAAFEPPAENVL